MKDFSEFLIYAMDKCGFDYRSLSKRTGIKHEIVWRLVYNNQIPTIEQYILILNVIVKHSDLGKNFTNTRMIKSLENQLSRGNNNGNIKGDR
jgi:hypothetical protein